MEVIFADGEFKNEHANQGNEFRKILIHESEMNEKNLRSRAKRKSRSEQAAKAARPLIRGRELGK